MATDEDKRLQRRIGQLEDDLKQRDARIAELRAEVDEERTLVEEMREHMADCDELIDSFIEAFSMTQNDKGNWVWTAWKDEHKRYMGQHRD